jgi:hypothetical protein
MTSATPCKRDRRHALVKVQYFAGTTESLKFRNVPITKAEVITNDIQLVTSGRTR